MVGTLFTFPKNALFIVTKCIAFCTIPEKFERNAYEWAMFLQKFSFELKHKAGKCKLCIK